MTEHRPGEVIATIQSLLPSLLPTEQSVASVLLARSAEIVELSSQQVAELARASRATVVRTCQSLGFTGYQQLRVLLARDAAYRPDEREPWADGAAGLVGETFRNVAAGVNAMIALLDGDSVRLAVNALADARRVVVIGNGLSAPVALDAAARFTSIGRAAEAPMDAIGQQITARLLTENDVVLVISGSGSSESTVRVARAAVAAGATVIAITAFARSPITLIAAISLVVAMPHPTFRSEVTLTSRLPQAILVEGLAAALTARLGETATKAKGLALDVISENLVE